MALTNKLNAIGEAIRAKTGKTNKMTLDEMPAEIAGIQSGGSVSRKKDVNFYDYDGTLLHSYTIKEAQALTELPELPTQPGLICQGWNYDLETIKSYDRPVNVGAIYITDDGKTRLYIKISFDIKTDVSIYFRQSVSYGVIIDWGDGSEPETSEYSGNKTITHTYSSVGDYIISLEVIDECILTLGNGSTNVSIMGKDSLCCNMLQRVEIGDKTQINKDAFNECFFLTNVTIPNNVTEIGQNAFYKCVSLTSISFPSSIKQIERQMFAGCEFLETAIMSDGVTNIKYAAFQTCRSLINIVIPNSVTDIENNVFYYCQTLKNIEIPYGITTIPDYMFSNCYELKNVILPNSITNISSRAFISCSSLVNIIIPTSVTDIGSDAFTSCPLLVSIVIPEKVSTINNILQNCTSLVSVIISSNVININGYAFSGCTGVKIYDFTSHTSVPTLAATTAFNNIPTDCEIRVPATLYDEWIAATNWSTYADYIVAV